MVTNRYLRFFLGANHPAYHGIVLVIEVLVAAAVYLIARKVGAL